MKTLLLFIILGVSILSSGQQAIISAGGDANGNGGSVSYSIGQVAYSHDIDGISNEGVQQPFELFVVSIDHVLRNFQLNVFPNPSSTEVIIAMETFNPGFSITVLSADGKLLETMRLLSSRTTIDVSSWPAANYLIMLSNEDGKTASYQIIKH
jgi:hypothetical protein